MLIYVLKKKGVLLGMGWHKIQSWKSELRGMDNTLKAARRKRRTTYSLLSSRPSSTKRLENSHHLKPVPGKQ